MCSVPSMIDGPCPPDPTFMYCFYWNLHFDFNGAFLKYFIVMLFLEVNRIRPPL